jgi:hypothetical protein
LSEQNLAEIIRCIQLCLDCVDVCTATLGVKPPGGLRRRRHQAAAAGLRGHLHQLRRRVRAACPALRALPGLRAGLPALRAGLPRAPGRPEIAHRPFWRALAHPPPSPIPLRHHARYTAGMRSELPLYG